MKAAPYRFYRHCTIDEDGIMTCHAGSGSELNISEEVFEFRLRDMESLNWMMRKARLEGRKIRPASLDERYFDNLLNYKRFQYKWYDCWRRPFMPRFYYNIRMKACPD